MKFRKRRPPDPPPPPPIWPKYNLRPHVSLADLVLREAKARGWDGQELLARSGLTMQQFATVIAGRMTGEVAEGLAEAFGVSPDYWERLRDLEAVGRKKA